LDAQNVSIRNMKLTPEQNDIEQYRVSVNRLVDVLNDATAFIQKHQRLDHDEVKKLLECVYSEMASHRNTFTSLLETRGAQFDKHPEIRKISTEMAGAVMKFCDARDRLTLIENVVC